MIYKLINLKNGDQVLYNVYTSKTAFHLILVKNNTGHNNVKKDLFIYREKNETFHSAIPRILLTWAINNTYFYLVKMTNKDKLEQL